MRRFLTTLSLLFVLAQAAIAEPVAIDGTVVTRSKTAVGCGYVRLKLGGAKTRDVLRITRKGTVIGDVMIFEVDGLYAMVMPIAGKKVDLRVGDDVTVVGHDEANVQEGLSRSEADQVMAGIRARTARAPVASSSRSRSSTWSPPDVKSAFTNFSPGQITDARGSTVSAGVTRDTRAVQHQFEAESSTADDSAPAYTPATVSQGSNGQVAVCRVCSKEGTRGLRVLAVGSFLCESCLNAPVTDSAKVEYNLYPFVTDVFERVIRWNTVGLKPNIEMEETGEGLLGYWPVESSGFTAGANHFSVIKVKRGTPLLLMLGVIAHEWSHAWWNRAHGGRLGDYPYNTLLYQEGFATWAMARFYRAIGQDAYFEQQVLPSLPLTPYRTGYRMFLNGTFKL